jgi:hypothetical protein
VLVSTIIYPNSVELKNMIVYVPLGIIDGGGTGNNMMLARVGKNEEG